jgi:hypothetical protein
MYPDVKKSIFIYKNMKKFLFSFFCFLFTLSLSAQKSNTFIEWVTYTDSLYNFTVLHPSDWEFKTPGTSTRFFVTSYADSDTDNFRENVNCIVRKIEQTDFKISQAEDALKKSLGEKLKNFTIINSVYSQWNDAETLEMEYSCTRTSNGTEFRVHNLQRMAVVNGILFTLTYTAEEGSYNKYIGTVKKVIASLKVN